jgi:hypothetical protein
MAGELPEDALENIMIAEAMGHQEGPQLQNRNEGDMNMPGEFPVLFADFTDDEDEGEGEAGAAAPIGDRGLAQVRAQNIREALGDAESSSDDDDEDSEEEDVAVSPSFDRTCFCILICLFKYQPMPVRMIRNLMNRIWGGSATAAAGDSSEEEEADGSRPVDHDDGGVD